MPLSLYSRYIPCWVTCHLLPGVWKHLSFSPLRDQRHLFLTHSRAALVSETNPFYKQNPVYKPTAVDTGSTFFPLVLSLPVWREIDRWLFTVHIRLYQLGFLSVRGSRSPSLGAPHTLSVPLLAAAVITVISIYVLACVHMALISAATGRRGSPYWWVIWAATASDSASFSPSFSSFLFFFLFFLSCQFFAHILFMSHLQRFVLFPPKILLTQISSIRFVFFIIIWRVCMPLWC